MVELHSSKMLILVRVQKRIKFIYNIYYILKPLFNLII
jgi:hypothetical protein